MEYRVIIDPSHGGTDPGLVHQGRKEKDDVLRLALAIGNELEEKGITAVYTRMTDVYYSPFERAAMANSSGADLLLSIHRRAKRNEPQSLGVEHVLAADHGMPAALAGNIAAHLSKIGYRDLGIVEKPSLALLRDTRIPTVMTEIGFEDDEIDNRFFDQNLELIAAEVASAVQETLAQETVEPQPVYRIQTGAYQNGNLADQQLMQLRSQGLPAISVYDDGLFKVQVGAFTDVEAAAEMERALRFLGYNTFITTL